ncbi:MAG: OmpA family protein, partial [Ancalomicrobiaceae bacterium]|nr:OmpA family protein [Ancalomicrobiaceae bacterium]
FDSGKADVKPEFKAIAVRISQMLEKEAGPIQVIGHTDNTPVSKTNRFKNNFDLSVARAQNAAVVLKAGLSDPARIKTEGRGEEDPVVLNDSDAHKAKNRRVELWIDRVE